MASNYLWLFDNGHGGIINDVYQTAGKRSPILEDGSQLFEGEFNRAVVKRMVMLCEQEEIDFINLVDTEMDVRLSERTDLANDIFRNTYQTSGQKCIYVSIHADAFTPDNKLEFNGAHGWSVYTSPGETKSDDIATVFYEEMKKIFPDQKFRTDLSDGDVDKEAKFWVLRKTVMPAILTENFFMTNLENCKLLLSEDGRDQIALAHFNAMKRIEDQLIF